MVRRCLSCGVFLLRSHVTASYHIYSNTVCSHACRNTIVRRKKEKRDLLRLRKTREENKRRKQEVEILGRLAELAHEEARNPSDSLTRHVFASKMADLLAEGTKLSDHRYYRDMFTIYDRIAVEGY